MIQIAEVLSDLYSLRVCDHSAALALVTVHKAPPTSAATSESHNTDLGSGSQREEDVDMKRAMDLVELHYGVKMKYMQGEDAGLKQARSDVDRVLEKMERKEMTRSRTWG